MRNVSRSIVAIAIASALVVSLFGSANSLPAGKTAYSQSYPRTAVFDPKISVLTGAAANASIRVAGFSDNAIVLSAILIDTTATGRPKVQEVIDSTYYQDGDSIRCGVATSGGYVILFWKKN
jgi:hypothetical protein